MYLFFFFFSIERIWECSWFLLFRPLPLMCWFVLEQNKYAFVFVLSSLALWHVVLRSPWPCKMIFHLISINKNGYPHVLITYLLLRWRCEELRRQPGGRLNIKMSFQYRDPHVKDKTVSRPSYLKHGNPHTWERQSGSNPVYCEYSAPWTRCFEFRRDMKITGQQLQSLYVIKSWSLLGFKSLKTQKKHCPRLVHDVGSGIFHVN